VVCYPFGWHGKRFRTFQVCLKDGFVEGRDVAIEYRWAEDQYDRSVVDWNLFLGAFDQRSSRPRIQSP